MDVPRRSARGASPRGRTRSPALLRKLAFVAAVVALPTAALAAATVKGRLAGQQKLLNPVWLEAKDPKAKTYTFREPSATVRADVREMTSYLPKELCIAAIGAAAPAQKPTRIVTIAGGRTTPVTIVVAEGQAVQFDNKDPFAHKLYETNGKMVAADILPTKSRTWTPTGTGKFEFRDSTSPSIRSWVVVVPNVVAITHPDKKGEFAIELEQGTYKLRGYHNGDAVGQELEVTVGAGTADVPLKSPLVVGDLPQDAGTGG